ncbi:MAG: glycosyltransferase [Eubacteriales bacterium]|nr:glycosyltransferase [Eubacteriales bacterium]
MSNIEVIIPSYRPGEEFEGLLELLSRQTLPVSRILVINTEERYWNQEWEKKYPLLQVVHISKAEFDHGGTRRKGAAMARGDILVFMTQDAIPADTELIDRLTAPIRENKRIGAAYARQLPREDCSPLERCTRAFNYPETSLVKWEKDVPRYGVKTYFCSNVCAAYSRRIYEEVGGFVERTIFNEDMIYAGTMAKRGYGIAYQADACVIHSHDYSCRMQLCRNFDLGVSQAEHPQIFEAVSSEGEGLRLVKRTLGYLWKTGRIWLIPVFVLQSASKYLGYFLGKRFRSLPRGLILALTMNPGYWRD